MENTVEQKASSEAIIDRLGNYRIIVWSLLWNFIVIYILFKIIPRRLIFNLLVAKTGLI